MKIKISLILYMTMLFTSYGQTLYVPGGTASGIGASGNGSVGIGTSNPLKNLHVDGGTSGSSFIIGTTAVTNRTALWFHALGTTGKASIQSWWTGVNQGSLSLNPDGGRIGIGTLSPETNLHIDGGVTGSSVRIGNTTSLNRTSLWLQTEGETGNATIQSWWAGVNQGNILLNPSGGNVGIGTASTDAKLTVKGDIHTREVRVDMDGSVGPDYVFEPNYNLLSLSEVETYIDQNKHLPEVPSAKEMEVNGLNLKEMNLLLLKKVEELTLHLIEQEKVISMVVEENAELKGRMNKLEKRKP